jgi:cytochrome c oxidase assembly protein subunit 16
MSCGWNTPSVAAEASLIHMPTFTSKPLSPAPLNKLFRKNPLLFGVPFVLIIVGASYGLVPFAQTRYDLQDQKVFKVCTQFQHSYRFNPNIVQMTKEQELGLNKNRKKFDIREEYFVSPVSCVNFDLLMR